MAFDNPTRNRLNSFVGRARRLITEEFTQQFRSLYGISESGVLTPFGDLKHLDEEGLATAALLRARIDYLIRTQPAERDGAKVAVARLAREQAFTILNRLAAVRMAEKRGLIVESVGRGYQSKGFQVFEKIAGSNLGDSFHRYRRYLFCLFDELSVDLGVLFDRRSPQALLFPREPALLDLFELINAPDLDALWAEDETIGWIYQYYNDQAERKTMREQSSAPRNSRELAVRNQFFTPRYVVEFLTDNTLGRIWYEMTQGATALQEQCRYLVRRPTEIFLKPGETVPEQPEQDNLSQEELLKQPVHIPHRPLKDPRTILMLDPACGSMHFGLYAFDLFEIIYDEAWSMEEGGTAVLNRPMTMKSLHGTYADKQAFLRDVPRLIIEYNIHGIDIDPRCAQIAGLSLWLRAQKAWQRLGLKPAERPAIKRSNIVCAEPMPGEKELLREFVEREFPAAERAVCLRLLEAIFDKMQLAGEAGSLLKIEEEIRSAIEDARDAWQKLATRPPELFTTTELNQLSTAPELTGLEQAESSLTTDPRHLTTDFWERIEERIYAALRDYAEQAENGGGFQRRLFAEDAARGFAFIDVCRKRYDVVLMNPPYGDFSDSTLPMAKLAYEGFSANIYSAFWSRATVLATGGRIGALTSRTFLTLSQFSRVRELLLRPQSCLLLVADLGSGVLDGAAVDTCASVASCESQKGENQIGFIQLDQSDNRAETLLEIIQRACSPAFWWPRSVFHKLPGSRFFYWAPAAILKLFSKEGAIEGSLAEVRPGLLTGDDFRFLSLWWELPNDPHTQREWFTFAKGGDYERYYADLPFKLNWRDDGREVKAYAEIAVGSVSKWIFNESYFFRGGLTFPNSSALGFSVRCLPADSIISVKGQGIFSIHSADKSYLLALLNTPLVHTMLLLFNPGKDVQAGDVKQLPFITPNASAVEIIARTVSEILNSIRCAHQFDETSQLFAAFADSVKLRGSEGRSIFALHHQELLKTASTVAALENIVDAQIYAECGLSPEVVEALSNRAKRRPNSLEVVEHSLKDIYGINTGAFLWFSLSLGVAFGRWDIRYATGEESAPELPDPFAPLPVCPPGQLQNAYGLPAGPEDVPDEYPVRIPWDGILVDDPNHPLDIERRVREVIEIIWNGKEGGLTAEAIEHEACELLDVKSLRDYFRKPAGFFADHLKRYSKSRRQAPIYWPLSTASGSYTLWIYYHRLTDQTLHTVLADFLQPKIKSVEQEISGLRIQGKVGGQIGDLQSFLDELEELRAELERVIKLPWKPNLNDGVLITAAPLWKLFRLGKWQKDLKACWEELEAGDYDWAHLAYTIWPDRVRAKCKQDRSLAIAHGLESICEIEAPKPKKPKKVTTKAADEELSGLETNDEEHAASPRKVAVPRANRATSPKPTVAAPPAARPITEEEPALIPIDQTDRDEVMCMIRQVFSEGGARDRETALRQVSSAFGYKRLGPKARAILETDFLTAVRRGILTHENGELRLTTGSVRDFSRESLKDDFLKSLGRTWKDREEAIRLFARFLGYARTGPAIEETARSLINGLLRENRLESDGSRIRRHA